MREIKFRAWDKDSKKMFKIARFDFSDYTIYSHLFACDGYLGESCEIMQYTGLKDKNGKEIYEGDVVLYDRNINHNIDKYKYVVSYENGLFYLDHHFSEITDGVNWGLLEIIGNIHGF